MSTTSIPNTPTYYITSVDLDFDPIIGDTVPGNVTVEIGMYDPDFHDDSMLFTCRCELEISLQATGANDEDTEYETMEMGDIDVDMIIALEGNNTYDSEYYQAHIDQWEDEGYTSTSDEFQMQIESELLHDVFYPLSSLLRDSYRGIIPRIRFQPNSED
jgi:hypothetical protein